MTFTFQIGYMSVRVFVSVLIKMLMIEGQETHSPQLVCLCAVQYRQGAIIFLHYVINISPSFINIS